MVELAKILLDAGARKTRQMKVFVEEIGKNFEFHRSRFDPTTVDAASQALNRLYEIFEIPPVSRRVLHDGKSSITVRAIIWQTQHAELWELLVPSSGPAATIQGEVIRISGRIAKELEGNGGLNWDADFNKMADAFLKHIRLGEALPRSDLDEATAIVTQIKLKTGNTARMAKLAVKWVLQNPQPMNLDQPTYDR